MDFATLFRLGENLNLDRKTLVILRWIAIIGQFSAITIVYFYLKLEFLYLIAYFILAAGALTNIYLQFGIKTILIKDFKSSIFLAYDLFQLTALLYLTGGISNPFSIIFNAFLTECCKLLILTMLLNVLLHPAAGSNSRVCVYSGTC